MSLFPPELIMLHPSMIKFYIILFINVTSFNVHRSDYNTPKLTSCFRGNQFTSCTRPLIKHMKPERHPRKSFTQNNRTPETRSIPAYKDAASNKYWALSPNLNISSMAFFIPNDYFSLLTVPPLRFSSLSLVILPLSVIQSETQS